MASALGIALLSAVQPSAPETITWRLDNLLRFGDQAIEVIGAPAVVQSSIGQAIQFNGVSDGLLIDRNPIAGLTRFTIEVLFAVDAEGPVEQRFLHVQDSAADNRALVGLRLNNGRWALDSYLRHDAAQLTLLDPTRSHDAGAWHVSTTTSGWSLAMSLRLLATERRT